MRRQKRRDKVTGVFPAAENPVAAVATKRQHQNSRGQKRTSSVTNVLAVAVTRFERIPLTLAFLMSAVSHWMLNGTTSALLAELVLEDWTRDIPGTLTVGCGGKTLTSRARRQVAPNMLEIPESELREQQEQEKEFLQDLAKWKCRKRKRPRDLRSLLAQRWM